MNEETFILNEKQLDIIHEALTLYRDLATEGSYAYEDTEIDEVLVELGFED